MWNGWLSLILNLLKRIISMLLNLLLIRVRLIRAMCYWIVRLMGLVIRIETKHLEKVVLLSGRNRKNTKNRRSRNNIRSRRGSYLSL